MDRAAAVQRVELQALEPLREAAEEMEVLPVYFQITASTGEKGYYLLEIRNSDTENRNLNYIKGEYAGERW